MIPVRSIAYFATLLVLCTLPAVASAQPWRDAFRAGEYAKAADLLHDIVSDPENVLHGNPDALRLFAEMYRDGLGVPRDPIAACSLAQDAEMAAQMTPPARPMQTMTDAVAYGVVVDDTGRPLSGILVEAVAAELAGYGPDAIFDPVTTDARGWFAFDYLPPGTYVFGVNVTKGRYKPPSGPATFLPGTAAVKDAAVVELKPGDRTDVGVLRIPSR
jgi:hypothetical protein